MYSIYALDRFRKVDTMSGGGGGGEEEGSSGLGGVECMRGGRGRWV